MQANPWHQVIMLPFQVYFDFNSDPLMDMTQHNNPGRFSVGRDFADGLPLTFSLGILVLQDTNTLSGRVGTSMV